LTAGTDKAAVEAGRGALFIGFAKAFFMVSGFLQQVLLARLISVAEFGAFAVVNGVISMVNNTVVQATIQAVSKFTAEDERRADAVKRAALKMQLVLGTLLGLGFFLGAPLIAAFEKAPGYVNYFRIAAAIPFLYALYTVFVGSANGLRRFRTQASFDVGFSIAKTILLLGCAALWRVTGAFVGFVSAAVVILVVSARVMGLPRRGSRGGAVETTFDPWQLVRFMGTVVAYVLLLNAALLYDLPLLQHFAGTVDPQRAATVAGHYHALRTLALLPYQALLVITFVIFPLVSRSTFAQDRDATRAYVTQTLRYALILAVAMGLCLGARPGALLGILYKPEYGEGASALPILVAGECCLALLAVSCAILNAAGRAHVALALMAITVAVGVGGAYLSVPRTTPGAAMLTAAATATATGMATGFVLAIVYVRTRLGGSPPLRSVARVTLAAAAAVLVGRFFPGQGKLLGLVATLAVGAVYLVTLVALGEFGPEDKAKIAKILRRRSGDPRVTG
jgi:O-antigen/teichoic acid export membrane protein